METEGLVFELDDAAEKRRAKRVEKYAQWVERFPNKNEWCKRYLAMRRAYFKLNGVGPMQGEHADSGAPFAQRINFDYLSCAIDTVLDVRGISHFSADDTFASIYESLLRLSIGIERLIYQERAS